MAQIPFATNRVMPQVQSMPRGSMEVAGMAGKALAGLGETVANIGEKGMSLATQFQAKKTALKDTTDILEANNKIEERLAAFKETAATKTDPQDIVKFTNEWKTTLPKDFQMESYSPEVKARVQIALDHAANVGTIEGYGGLDAQGNPMGGYAFKAQSKKMDIPLVQMQQNALDGKWAMHPVTGEQLSPEKAFEYAAKERMKLGTETPEQGMKSIRTFGQNQAYQTSYKQLLTDYPKFVSEYDPTKLSEFHQGQIALQKGHIEEQIRSNTDNATERLLKSFQAKAKASPSELGPADLESAKIPVSVGFGVTKTILSPDMEVTYQNTISGKKNADKMSPELINAYSELNRIKGQTVRDVTAKQVDDILKRINKGKNSPATNIQIMDDVAAIFTIGKDYDKNLFDAYQIKPFQQEASQEISDTFKKAITYGNNKATTEAFLGKFRSLNELFKEKGSKITKEDVDAWKKDNLYMFHADNAKQEFFSRNVTAPQTNTVPVVKISADYDSVPKGSKYIHPDGSVRTKQ